MSYIELFDCKGPGADMSRSTHTEIKTTDRLANQSAVLNTHERPHWSVGTRIISSQSAPPTRRNWAGALKVQNDKSSLVEIKRVQCTHHSRDDSSHCLQDFEQIASQTAMRKWVLSTFVCTLSPKHSNHLYTQFTPILICTCCICNNVM